MGALLSSSSEGRSQSTTRVGPALASSGRNNVSNSGDVGEEDEVTLCCCCCCCEVGVLTAARGTDPIVLEPGELQSEPLRLANAALASSICMFARAGATPWRVEAADIAALSTCLCVVQSAFTVTCSRLSLSSSSSDSSTDFMVQFFRARGGLCKVQLRWCCVLPALSLSLCACTTKRGAVTTHRRRVLFTTSGRRASRVLTARAGGGAECVCEWNMHVLCANVHSVPTALVVTAHAVNFPEGCPLYFPPAEHEHEVPS